MAVELTPAPKLEDAFLRFASRPHCLLLDSALKRPELGRYSFLAADPFAYVESKNTGNPVEVSSAAVETFAQTEALWRQFPAPTRADLPPFQGGAAGLLSYDLGRAFEPTPPARWNEFQTPAVALGFYDVVLAFDHAQNRAWIVSQGFPETDPVARRRRAERRLAEVEHWLNAPVAPPVSAEKYPQLRLAPQFAVPGPAGLTSNFSAAGFKQAVRQVIDYIHAGDIFQANLAQRLLFPAHGDAVSLYLRLRQRNPATFAGYFDGGAFQIASASPERFVKMTGRQVEARPIKGTRARFPGPEADLFAGDDLRASQKDRSENIMIVDLLRNDLSRVCRPESVRVSQLCALESYEYVQHLVSVVQGELQEDKTAFDLIRAAFPGGSIVGAPKPRAMQIISELEPTARGAYCGALGYLGFDGSLDLSILIRTITVGGNWWQLPVGGGIVAESSPESEYEETWHKAKGLLKALV